MITEPAATGPASSPSGSMTNREAVVVAVVVIPFIGATGVMLSVAVTLVVDAVIVMTDASTGKAVNTLVVVGTAGAVMTVGVAVAVSVSLAASATATVGVDTVAVTITAGVRTSGSAVSCATTGSDPSRLRSWVTRPPPCVGDRKAKRSPNQPKPAPVRRTKQRMAANGSRMSVANPRR